MTKQEVFDKVATHLLTQMRRAWNENLAICAYRAPNGDKCAIGCLIPDERYREQFEENGVFSLFHEYDLSFLGLDLKVTSIEFLDKLQRIHDSKIPEEWFFGLEDLGLEEGLSIDCLEPFRSRIDKLVPLEI